MQQRVERAAGGMVVRVRAGKRQVLLIDDAYGHVTFPKGHVERGETWEDTAIREVREETGIEARILQPLSRLEYAINREGLVVRKQVRLFLMEEIDHEAEPHHQSEEIRGAYFLNWEEAVRRHRERGYVNWSFVFEKADALWAWHQADLERRFRSLAPDATGPDFESMWREAAPVVDQMIGAVGEELACIAPDWGGTKGVLGAAKLPRGVTNEREAMRDAIEHTLLKPEASELAIDNLCDEALKHQFRAVCVNPQNIRRVAERLQPSAVIPCVVVGFPLGATDVVALAAETAAVVSAGAREVDMVIPVGSMAEDDVWSVYDRVKAVCDTAHATDGVRIKVILEAHFLSFAQLAMASLVSLAAGADFIKTSTGFAPTGAKLADVGLMSLLAGDKGVKAAGGIRSMEAALQFLRFGATRLGTSSGVALVR